MKIFHRLTHKIRLFPAAALSFFMLSIAHAQTARFIINQPSLPLDTAINQVARQSGVQVLFASDIANRLTAPALHGEFTAHNALELLLEGTGLALKERGEGTYIISESGTDETAARSKPSSGLAVETLQRVTVVASRVPRSIEETPNTVWIIEREQIETQARAGVSLKEMLGQLVPGLDMGGQMRTNFGQNLRGRPAQVMIDGISLNGSRLLSRQFDSINPFNIDRIEVLSGATAIYGGNATGGIINIITKRADVGEPAFTSEVGIRTAFQEWGDFTRHAAQSVQGGNDVIQGRLAVAYSRNGGSYDGNGDRVLPDITQTDLQWNQAIDIMGTTDINLQRGATLKLSAQYYDSGYKPGKALWMQPGPGNNVLRPSAIDIRDGFSSDVKPNTHRHLLALDYHKPDMLGDQSLYLKAYHRDESLKFYPFPGADANPLGGARVPYWSTSTQQTTTYGFKAMMMKDWSHLRLSYGADYDHEKFSARQTMFDVNRAIASGGLKFKEHAVLGRYPGFDTDIWGLYAQADAKLTDTLTFSAGVRHQQVDISVDDFVQVAQQRLVAAGYGSSAQAIPGGKNDYAATLFNAGLIYQLTPKQQVWANYSEGFELADPAKYYGAGATYGALSNTSDMWQLNRYISVNGTRMAAVKTKSMELGWRLNQGGWSAQAALFHSQSDKSIVVDRATLNITLGEAKVRNFGLEGQVDYHWGDCWFAGGNMLLLRTEQNDNGKWNRRGIYQASPSKATAYVGRQTDHWGVRLQAAHSFRLNSDVPSFGTGDGESLPSLTLFDLLANYRIKHGNGITGTISLGVQNLLNKTYSTRWSKQAKLAYASWISPSVLDFKGQGRTFALTYTLKY